MSRQKKWTYDFRAILAETQNVDSDVKNIVNAIIDHENIPRKKPKFSNFVNNIMRNRASTHSIDKTWGLFSQALKPPTPLAAKGIIQEKDDVEMDVHIAKSGEDTEKKEKKRKKANKKCKSATMDGDTEMAFAAYLRWAQKRKERKKLRKEQKKDKRRAFKEEDNISETSEKQTTVTSSKKKVTNKEIVMEESKDLNKHKKPSAVLQKPVSACAPSKLASSIPQSKPVAAGRLLNPPPAGLPPKSSSTCPSTKPPSVGPLAKPSSASSPPPNSFSTGPPPKPTSSGSPPTPTSAGPISNSTSSGPLLSTASAGQPSYGREMNLLSTFGHGGLILPGVTVQDGFPPPYSRLRNDLGAFIACKFCPVPGGYVHFLWMYEQYQRTMMYQGQRVVVSPSVFSFMVPEFCGRIWEIMLEKWTWFEPRYESCDRQFQFCFTEIMPRT